MELRLRLSRRKRVCPGVAVGVVSDLITLQFGVGAAVGDMDFMLDQVNKRSTQMNRYCSK
eukprot:7420093-Pyramimonas_sp.AAC.2